MNKKAKPNKRIFIFDCPEKVVSKRKLPQRVFHKSGQEQLLCQNMK